MSECTSLLKHSTELNTNLDKIITMVKDQIRYIQDKVRILIANLELKVG